MAALSDVAICNMAIGHIGRTASQIASLSERSTEARLCSLWYDQCRREVLEAHDWGFARARLPLALHSDAPPDEWAFRYQTPSDLVAIRRVWNPFNDVIVPFGNFSNFPLGDLGNAVPYELETSLDGQTLTLLTNLDTALLLYTRDQTFVQMFTPLFVDALSHYLAAKIAFGATGNPSIEKKEADAFAISMRAASASSANQSVQSGTRDSYSVRARS